MKPYINSDQHYQHTDGRILRTGKGPALIDDRTLKIEKYLTARCPPAPQSLNWYGDFTEWGMMLNDVLGDCTIASKAHALQVASLNSTGETITLTDDQILHYYEVWDGYNPQDPASDQGGVMLDVLNRWRKHKGHRRDGFKHHGLAGHKLYAYCAIDLTIAEHAKKCIELFGPLDIGLQLPISAQRQIGGLWDVGDPSNPDSQPGSWGGHDVTAAAYDEEGIEFLTWGGRQKATWRFFHEYADEGYALILGMTLDNKPTGFTGFSREELDADLARIAAASGGSVG